MSLDASRRVSSTDTASGSRPMMRRCGLLTLRPRWGLSWQGWLVFTFAFIAAAYLFVCHIYSFLAVTSRVNADTLVVEGWVHDYAIRAAAIEFNHDHCAHLFTTGGPVAGKGGYINDYNTSASVGAELLVKAGLPADSVQMVPSQVMGRDRTYSSAVALREWLTAHNMAITALNVLTEDAHARRTRLLFQEALGPKVRVGVIAVRSPDYNGDRWWQYSDGVREVLGEAIAYVYAKFLFRPSRNELREGKS